MFHDFFDLLFQLGGYDKLIIRIWLSWSSKIASRLSERCVRSNLYYIVAPFLGCYRAIGPAAPDGPHSRKVCLPGQTWLVFIGTDDNALITGLGWYLQQMLLFLLFLGPGAVDVHFHLHPAAVGENTLNWFFIITVKAIVREGARESGAGQLALEGVGQTDWVEHATLLTGIGGAALIQGSRWGLIGSSRAYLAAHLRSGELTADLRRHATAGRRHAKPIRGPVLDHHVDRGREDARAGWWHTPPTTELTAAEAVLRDAELHHHSTDAVMAAIALGQCAQLLGSCQGIGHIAHSLHGLLNGQAVPQPFASQDEELVLGGEENRLHVGARHHTGVEEGVAQDTRGLRHSIHLAVLEEEGFQSEHRAHMETVQCPLGPLTGAPQGECCVATKGSLLTL